MEFWRIKWRRFVIQHKFGELPECLDIYQDICRNWVGHLAMVVYFLDFLDFQDVGNQLVGFSATSQPWKCCLGCAALAERLDVVQMDFHPLISVQGGQFNLMLMVPVVHLTLHAQILMHHHRGTRWGHQNPFPWGFFSFSAPFPWGSVQVGSCSCVSWGWGSQNSLSSGGTGQFCWFPSWKMFLDTSRTWNSAWQESSSPFWPSEDSEWWIWAEIAGIIPFPKCLI